MPYDINEGRFGFDCLEDGTINILELPPHEDGTPLRLVVTRDKLGSGEDVKGYLTRQLRELSRHFPEFKELKREAGWLGSGNGGSFSAIVLQAQFRQDGKWVYQGQCVAELPEGKLLVLTLTSPQSFDDKLRARWVELLSRFVPSPALSPA
jgi:hypothetical protein